MSNKLDALLRGLVDDQGEPKYSKIEVDDVMAVVFMQSYQAVALSSQAADDLMAGLFSRAGVETEEDVENLGERLETYFATTPLNQELLQMMQSTLRSDQAPAKTVRAGYAIGSAF